MSAPIRTRRWWWSLLFEPGQGWLRWGFETRTFRCGTALFGLLDEESAVAPPVRRIAEYLRGWVRAPIGDRPLWEDIRELRAPDRGSRS